MITPVKLNVVFLVIAYQPPPTAAILPNDSDSNIDEEDQQQGIPLAFATILANLTAQIMAINANIA